MPGPEIFFLATSRSGLGHLRRAATIAGRLRALAPGRRLHLVTNAPPDGLPPEDLAAFAGVHLRDRARMAEDLPAGGPRVLVLDTIAVPGIERLAAPLALVLRETPEAELPRFRLPGGRGWDLLVLANPAADWQPPPAALPARRVVAAGWIYRPAGPRATAPEGPPQVLVATGGGGTAGTAGELYPLLDQVIAEARRRAPPFQVVQAIGPRARAFGRLAGADRIADPGPHLDAMFAAADVALSTAGYNSVLELATTDTPALLVPIPRSIDDQEARARRWGARLGAWLDRSAPGAAADWLAGAIAARHRRPPFDLGPGGEDAAARAILGLR